jgi:hypothetical protein
MLSGVEEFFVFVFFFQPSNGVRVRETELYLEEGVRGAFGSDTETLIQVGLDPDQNLIYNIILFLSISRIYEKHKYWKSGFRSTTQVFGYKLRLGYLNTSNLPSRKLFVIFTMSKSLKM